MSTTRPRHSISDWRGVLLVGLRAIHKPGCVHWHALGRPHGPVFCHLQIKPFDVVYDGTVGQYDDLTGKGRTDSLDISYGKYKLSLDATGSGTCAGVIRLGGATTTAVSCETSGSLEDAFFTNPDQVLLWLANLYFK